MPSLRYKIRQDQSVSAVQVFFGCCPSWCMCAFTRGIEWCMWFSDKFSAMFAHHNNLIVPALGAVSNVMTSNDIRVGTLEAEQLMRYAQTTSVCLQTSSTGPVFWNDSFLFQFRVLQVRHGYESHHIKFQNAYVVGQWMDWSQKIWRNQPLKHALWKPVCT